MPNDSAHYRSWSEKLRSPWFSVWAIARTGVLLVLRRKLFWLLLGLAALNFLFMFAVIYVKAQISEQNPGLRRFVDNILESVAGTGTTYRDFMFAQGTVTMLLLAFAGEMLVGSDHRQGGLKFYLSRRLDTWHYVLGKLLTIGLLVSLTTTIPALILYVEYGLLTDSLTYFRENLQILFGILGYGLVLSVVLSLLLFALASWLQRTVPLIMSWACIFVFLPALGVLMRELYDDRRWLWLMLWRDVRILGSWCFNDLSRRDEELFVGAVVVVAVVCIGSILAFIPRVRAVKVVQ